MIDGDGGSKRSLFGLTPPRLAMHHLVASKAAATARRDPGWLFAARLVVDGFAIYPIVSELEKNIEIAYCWAHVDRTFKDAKDLPEWSAEIQTLIHQLYEVEWEVPGYPSLGGACPGATAAPSSREITT